MKLKTMGFGSHEQAWDWVLQNCVILLGTEDRPEEREELEYRLDAALDMVRNGCEWADRGGIGGSLWKN